MSANGGAIDHLDVAVVNGGDGAHKPVPYARFSPSNEAIVACGARAIAVRQIAPRRTGSQHQTPVIDAGHASWLVRQKRLDRAPFVVSHVVSAHTDNESDLAKL